MREFLETVFWYFFAFIMTIVFVGMVAYLSDPLFFPHECEGIYCNTKITYD